MERATTISSLAVTASAAKHAVAMVMMLIVELFIPVLAQMSLILGIYCQLSLKCAESTQINSYFTLYRIFVIINLIKQFARVRLIF